MLSGFVCVVLFGRLCAYTRVCAYWEQVLSLTTGWTCGHEAVAACLATGLSSSPTDRIDCSISLL